MLTLLLSSLISSAAHASTCGELFVLRGKLHSQSEKLQPEIKWESRLENLFSQLKNEEQRTKIEPQHARHLKDAFSKSYDILNLESSELLHFYTNAIHGVYHQVAEAIYLQAGERVLGRPSTRMERDLLIELVALAEYPRDLRDRTIRPDQTKQIFETLKSLDQPLEAALQALAAWKAARPEEKQSWNFVRWVNPEIFGLTSDQVQWISQALNRLSVSRICCVHPSPCANCPLNRRKLKKGG